MANHIDAEEINSFINNHEGLYNMRLDIESDLKSNTEDYNQDEAFDRFQELIILASDAYSATISESSISDSEIDKASQEMVDEFEAEHGI